VAKAFLDLSGPQRELRDLAAALRKQENGKDLRKELVSELRSAAGPVRNDARAEIKSMPSRGTRKGGRSLRSAIAQKITVQAKTTGAAVGVRIIAGQTPNVRGFTNAARNTNMGSWRHPIFGDRNRWVTQSGHKGWFYRAMRRAASPARAGVRDAMNKIAEQIARDV